MLLNIIFSYNRAMQVDYLLFTILNRLKIPDYSTVILYHTTGDHHLGYKKLIEKYKTYPNISFVERKEVWFDISFLKTFNSKKNFNFFLEKNLKNKKGDNFKGLLQNLLKKTKHDFVMFNTDDGVFYDDVILDNDVISVFRENPNTTSYRMYVGDNIDGFPNYIEKKSSYYQWDYYTDKNITHWSYPFSVDGTVYNTKYLLSVLEKVPYHNPITLEENMFRYALEHKLFRNGISPLSTKLVGTTLNRVSTDNSNPTINISVDYLNQKFTEGYTLRLNFPEKITVVNIVPFEVIIEKGDEKIIIYSIDDEGKKVQSSYGIEGTKKD
ncbi:hypothetical protein DRF68_05495 [Candidatus Chryseobacterium massiliae]|uniref:Glycosyl transferase n=2 Tax=Chryseobacterium group TaxID=2782232 RepID=A0A3D9BE54_9FLAO|nr:hypothetical protein [uncultured Chryseobacterium sp.]REC51738.1 hypothetical protein DRF68_05495 [Candidatus Chryseobacterium massiliae]